MRRKYAVHAGFVVSKTDGDRHFIGVGQLVRLYELRPDEYVVWDDFKDRFQPQSVRDEYIHLYPRYDGNYGRPDA